MMQKEITVVEKDIDLEIYFLRFSKLLKDKRAAMGGISTRSLADLAGIPGHSVIDNIENCTYKEEVAGKTVRLLAKNVFKVPTSELYKYLYAETDELILRQPTVEQIIVDIKQIPNQDTAGLARILDEISKKFNEASRSEKR